MPDIDSTSTTDHSVSPEARTRAGGVLNRVLADEFILSAATRDYHWNVGGPQFRSLRELFDEQYHQLDRWAERLGGQARSLGVAARTGWRDLVKARRFKPAPGAGLGADEMLAALVALHDCIAGHLRRDLGDGAEQLADRGTAELLTELAEYHETTAWMLGELRGDRALAEA